ncbi:DUF3558 domain-containing protein [Pseudonocardia zijingensis]|uniref:DUF3558 domain-containing protein n=1 Tax=Pseudonocardia zijingensis TaxID=153376 RepID=UPI0031DD2D79
MVVVVVLLLAGCTTITGQAGPAEPPAPTRPREVRIDGVDPCSLLTEAQRAELGLDAEPRSDVGPLPPYPGTDIPLCLFGGFQPRSISLGVALIGTTGVELYLSGNLAADIRQAHVQDYPAVVAIAPRNPSFCSVVIDVASGQAVDVNFRLDGPDASAPVESLCADAERAADAVLDTLIALR